MRCLSATSTPRLFPTNGGVLRVQQRCRRLPGRRGAAAEAAVTTTVVDAPPSQEQQQQGQQLEQLEELEKPRVNVGTDGIMFQGFTWDAHRAESWYAVVAAKLPELAAAGVTHLWLPPPSQSVSPEGYLPGQLYNLNSAYGSADELAALVRRVKEAGIHPMADVVINHRCADGQDEHGRWNSYGDDVDHEGHRIDWGAWAITGDDKEFGGSGNADTGADFGGAPDLDHANPHLREALTHWLQHLRDDIGFEGWRFDFAKGYAAEFVAEYVDGSGAAADLHVGEVWVDLDWGGEGGALATCQNPARDALVAWINGARRRASAFDFVTKGVLQEALKRGELWRLRDADGKAPGLLGWWPQRSVTFTDNHDTGPSQAHWPFPEQHLAAGYAYILTHPGMPCVWWPHYFGHDHGDGGGGGGGELRREIDTLLKLRRDAGVGGRAELTILAADADLYVAVVKGRRKELTLKLGPRYDMGALLPGAGAGWAKAAAGKDWCVWERALDEEGRQEEGADAGADAGEAGGKAA